MSERPLRDKISADELEYREYLKEVWKIEPTRRAMRELERQINKVLSKLGVDCTKDAESIRAQMEFLNIWIHSIDETQSKTAAGLYISAHIKGELQPYAYIAASKIQRWGGKTEYSFPVTYWQEEKREETWKNLN